MVREFVQRRFGIWLRRSACRTYLHRLGFVLKRPKKRLLKADERKRQAFVREHVDAFFRRLTQRAGEVKQRCRTVLQASADALSTSPPACNVDPVAA
ncbi:MAG: winged helix-turn-helix domain-containing protein [Chloroflexi bacterium]|nr:winged helix-turn-helix domain-containing protein [Chloroflexota bacterium]